MNTGIIPMTTNCYVRNAAMNEQKYSVLLLYPDYMSPDWPHETYYDYNWGKDPKYAIRNAQKKAFRENKMNLKHGESPDDFEVLLVIKGWQKDLQYETW